ncbi:MAG: enoyl-CoA hydratase/isomerase family protein [Actinomycetota bacterium]|nr:enoyl-CoA hydratase/isomerase family protein [Actinomycetota bacterium]
MPISQLILTPQEYDEFVRSPFADEAVGGPDGVTSVVVTGRTTTASPGALPVVVIALAPEHESSPAHADVVVNEAELATVSATIAAAPLAATSIAVLLRSMPTTDVEAGLAAESAVYSTLQAGPEFATWRAIAPSSPFVDDSPTVRVERDGDVLTVCLDRPRRHNAISTRLRDELTAALQLAVLDDSIVAVHLRGVGASFCSGGDLGEFGSRLDPASAHRTRLARSPARLIHRLRERTIVHLHGAALGGGIELAAFAGRIVAHPDTRIGLPEVSLGLIPGAGGTVSLPRRIGRQRTALLALTTGTIDAPTALRWGLIDEIVN